ncbi:AsmA family protein [Lutimaribacter marinistellae]|uniref:AsmA family protein n=1 Tax=Lutimaribacter marinistellae TaxID=1820329 RepID=A0ABV7TFA1_9RHOB
MRFLIRFSAILLVTVAIVIGALFLMPSDRLARVISDQLTARTGRSVEITGNARIILWPVLGLETGAVKIGNAPWAGPDPMLFAEEMSIAIQAASLLQGSIEIESLIARNPVLRLERQADAANWIAEQPGREKPAAQRSVTLQHLTFENAHIILTEGGRKIFDRQGVTIRANWPDTSGPLSAELQFVHEGMPIRADITLSNPAAYAQGGTSGLGMKARLNDSRFEFDGRLDAEGAIQGAATLLSSDVGDLIRLTGYDVPDFAEGLNEETRLSAQVTRTGNRLSLRDLGIGFGENTLQGGADITLGTKPVINAALQADRLDLTGLGSSKTAAAATGTKSGWSDRPIDASALAQLDGTISLSARSIKTHFAQLGETRATLTIDRARAVLQLDPVSIFRGTLRGQLVANNRNGLSVGGKISAENIEMKEALAVAAGISRLSGTASGQLEFLGIGQSEAAIMRSLSGAGGLQMGRGVISGLDLDALMGQGERGGGTTVFDSLTGSFRMSGGDLINNDLLMLLDNFRASGEGRVGIGARDIDYLLTPVALRANAGEGLTVPVRIVGPWAAPKIRPDLTQVIEKAAGVRAEEVETRAKDALRQKLGEELDRDIKPDDDLEELIRDRLEEEAAKGLRRLLGID